MIHVPLRRVRTTQPSGPTLVDWTNPINKGLLSFVYPGFEAVSRTPLPRHDTVSRHGRVWSKITGTDNTERYTFPVAPGLNGATECTLLIVGVPASSYSGFNLKVGSTNLADLSGIGTVDIGGEDQPYVATNSATNIPYYFGGFPYPNNCWIMRWSGGALSVHSDMLPGSYSTARAGTSIVCNDETKGIIVNSYYGGQRLAGAAVWNRALSLHHTRALLLNPWQGLAPQMFIVPLPVSTEPGHQPQLLAPISDISKGLWTPSSGSNLYPMLDESAADDADYIIATSPSSCEMRLATGNAPSVAGTYALRYRLLPGTGSIAAELRQGSTTLAAWGPHHLTASAQDFAQTLTAGQAAAITDYSDLRVVFTAS